MRGGELRSILVVLFGFCVVISTAVYTPWGLEKYVHTCADPAMIGNVLCLFNEGETVYLEEGTEFRESSLDIMFRLIYLKHV